MAVKSILEIDVQDDKFRDFNALFDRYRENLKGLPGQWGLVAAGVADAGVAFEQLSKKKAAGIVQGRIEEAAAKRAAELVRRMDRDAMTGLQRIKAGTEAWGNAVGKVAGQWKSVASYSAKTGTHIASATVSLLKWTSALGAVSALIGGAGGLFGIDRLAGSAAAGRRSSAGLGVSYGQQRAFSLDYGRFVDADGMLANVAGALSDKTSTGYRGLLGAGISSRYADTHDAADVSVEVLKRLPEIFKGVAPGLIGPTAQARGLTDILPVEDIKRYLAASPEERRQQEDAYRRDSKGLDVDPAVSRAWQDLTTQIGRAGSQIETTFIVGLKPLAKPIDDASSAFADLTAAFLKSDVVKTGIEGLAGGLESAAKFVGTQEFKDDVKGFVDDVGLMAKAMADAYKWVTGLFGRDRRQDVADDAKQTALAKFDPATDPATRGQGIWFRGFNKGKHGHATVRDAYNAEGNDDRVRQKREAFDRGVGVFTGSTDPKVKADVATTAKATGAIYDLMKGRQDAANADPVATFGHPADTGVGGVGAPSLRYGRDGSGGYHRTPHGGGGREYGDSPAGQGHAGTVKGSEGDRALQAMRYLVEQKGYTPEGAAIAVGNAMQESNVLPNGRPGDPKTPGGSHYMFQWNNGRNNDTVNGRRARYERWLREHNRDPNDYRSPLDYFDEERKHRSGLEGQWHAQRDLRNAGRLGHLFEGYGDNSEGTRVQNARDLLDKWNQGKRGAPSVRASGDASAPVGDAAAAAAEGRLRAGTGTAEDRAIRARYVQQQNTPKRVTNGEPVKVDVTSDTAFRLGKAFASSSPLLSGGDGGGRNALADLYKGGWGPRTHIDWDAERRKAAKAAEGLPRAKPSPADEVRDAAPGNAPRRASGLSDDRFQRKPMPHVLVQNNTGANVNVTAAMAGATVGYG